MPCRFLDVILEYSFSPTTLLSRKCLLDDPHLNIRKGRLGESNETAQVIQLGFEFSQQWGYRLSFKLGSHSLTLRQFENHIGMTDTQTDQWQGDRLTAIIWEREEREQGLALGQWEWKERGRFQTAQGLRNRTWQGMRWTGQRTDWSQKLFWELSLGGNWNH